MIIIITTTLAQTLVLTLTVTLALPLALKLSYKRHHFSYDELPGACISSKSVFTTFEFRADFLYPNTGSCCSWVLLFFS